MQEGKEGEDEGFHGGCAGFVGSGEDGGMVLCFMQGREGLEGEKYV